MAPSRSHTASASGPTEVIVCLLILWSENIEQWTVSNSACQTSFIGVLSNPPAWYWSAADMAVMQPDIGVNGGWWSNYTPAPTCQCITVKTDNGQQKAARPRRLTNTISVFIPSINSEAFNGFFMTMTVRSHFTTESNKYEVHCFGVLYSLLRLWAPSSVAVSNVP